VTAGVRKRRTGRRGQWQYASGGTATSSTVDTPKTILSDIIHTWLVAERGDVDLDAHGRVTRWRNRVGSGDPVEVSESTRPTFMQNGFAGGASCISGSGTQMLYGTLTTTIATAARPYVWVVGSWNSPGTGLLEILFRLQTSAEQSAIQIVRKSTGSLFAQGSLTDGVDDISVAEDGNAHLFEYGALETTTGKYVVDGVANNGARTGTTVNPVTTLCVFGFQRPVVGTPPGSMWGGEIAEVVVTKSLPTDAQKTDMREYFESRPYGLSIA